MPSQYNLPAIFGNAQQEDIAKFSKLPYYLARNECAAFPKWNVWDQLFGDINWQANMGDVLRGVTPQPSPVGESFFFPNDITTAPLKNVYEVTQYTNDARVKLHRYESKQFNFVPSFDAFWRDYIQYASKDMAKQIQVSNNIFIRTNCWFNSPYILRAGDRDPINAPQAPGNATNDAANSKNAAWMVGTFENVTENLSLRTVYTASMAMSENLQAPPVEQTRNMPAANSGMLGKYVLITSKEAFDNFLFDPDVALLKSINLDLLYSNFQGSLFGSVTCKLENYPLRFDVTGQPVAPQIYDANTQKTVPNPIYTNLDLSPWEIAFMTGELPYRTIKVGPPPREFAERAMSRSKFYSLKWNGEVQLTDQVLIQDGQGNIDLNVYGTQLKLISQATHGIIEVEGRFLLPILFHRRRPATVNTGV